MLITSTENVAWLLNIRGNDSNYSPIPNSYLLVDKLMRMFLFCDLKKVNSKFRKKLKFVYILNIKQMENFLKKLRIKVFQLTVLLVQFFIKVL